MGNSPIQMANFEDVQHAKKSSSCILINTLHERDQQVLIQNTVPCHVEIQTVEHAIRMKHTIVIYGKHSADTTAHVKYAQIKKLGGCPLLYAGGLFEWLLLQDIYGDENFPIDGSLTKPVDLYKFKPPNSL